MFHLRELDRATNYIINGCKHQAEVEREEDAMWTAEATEDASATQDAISTIGNNANSVLGGIYAYRRKSDFGRDSKHEWRDNIRGSQ